MKLTIKESNAVPSFNFLDAPNGWYITSDGYLIYKTYGKATIIYEDCSCNVWADVDVAEAYPGIRPFTGSFTVTV